MTFKINQFYNAKKKALIGFVPKTPNQTECHFRDSFSGKEFKVLLAITPKQIKNWWDGMLLQDAFSNLGPGLRELFLTGLTDKEFSAMLGEPE